MDANKSVSANFTAVVSCTYAVTPTDLHDLPAVGASPLITVTTPSGCPATATSLQPWVSVGVITPNGATTTVQLQVAANGGLARATVLVLAGRLFLVTQTAP